MKTPILAAAIVLTCAAAGAQELKGLTLGQSMASAIQAVGGLKRCRGDTPATKCILVKGDAPPAFQTFAGHPIEGLMINATGDKLGSIYIRFGNDPYDDIKAAMEQKYGPATCQDSTTGNAMGAVFPQQECNWHPAGGAALSLKRICGKIDLGCVFMSSKASQEAFDSDRQTKRTKAATSDL